MKTAEGSLRSRAGNDRLWSRLGRDLERQDCSVRLKPLKELQLARALMPAETLPGQLEKTSRGLVASSATVTWVLLLLK